MQENSRPAGRLKVATAKNGNKYFVGSCYPEENKGYFLRVTKKQDPKDEWAYTVWLEPMGKGNDNGQQEEVPF